MSPASSVSFDEDFELADDDFDEEDVYDMEKFSSCGYYTITILDLETGLHYTFERVLVSLDFFFNLITCPETSGKIIWIKILQKLKIIPWDIV